MPALHAGELVAGQWMVDRIGDGARFYGRLVLTESSIHFSPLALDRRMKGVMPWRADLKDVSSITELAPEPGNMREGGHGRRVAITVADGSTERFMVGCDPDEIVQAVEPVRRAAKRK